MVALTGWSPWGVYRKENRQDLGNSYCWGLGMIPPCTAVQCLVWFVQLDWQRCCCWEWEHWARAVQGLFPTQKNIPEVRPPVRGQWHDPARGAGSQQAAKGAQHFPTASWHLHPAVASARMSLSWPPAAALVWLLSGLEGCWISWSLGEGVEQDSVVFWFQESAALTHFCSQFSAYWVASCRKSLIYSHPLPMLAI